MKGEIQSKIYQMDSGMDCMEEYYLGQTAYLMLISLVSSYSVLVDWLGNYHDILICCLRINSFILHVAVGTMYLSSLWCSHQ